MRIEYESNEIPLMRPIYEDEEEFDSIEDIQITLTEIAQDLGYDYIELSNTKLGSGQIAITNDVTINVRYDSYRVKSLSVQIGQFNKNTKYDCTTNSSTIDNISVALQTASMILSEIRRKLK